MECYMPVQQRLKGTEESLWSPPKGGCGKNYQNCRKNVQGCSEMKLKVYPARVGIRANMWLVKSVNILIIHGRNTNSASATARILGINVRVIS